MKVHELMSALFRMPMDAEAFVEVLDGNIYRFQPVGGPRPFVYSAPDSDPRAVGIVISPQFGAPYAVIKYQ